MTSSCARTANGSLVRLRDIGRAVLGAQSYDFATRLNGKATAGILLFLRPGANAIAVRDAVARRLDELRSSFPPGIAYSIPFDTTPFVTASIKEVVFTLLEAMVLVALVVFLFLQSWRATLIPLLAVPVSVIGTFLGLLVLGFSINVLTLFALVLAIGIVVDDAIVVIENVERIMATEGVSARVAADRAIRQVAGALVAIVLSLVAVFLPVAFTGSVTGAMFKQFAITIVIAVVLSGLVALTLTPALCALLLQGDDRGAHVRASSAPSIAASRASPSATAARWTGCSAARARGSPSCRRDHRARRRALAARAQRVHPDRGQGLLRDRRAAARRGVAGADDGGGVAASRASCGRTPPSRTSSRSSASTS